MYSTSKKQLSRKKSTKVLAKESPNFKVADMLSLGDENLALRKFLVRVDGEYVFREGEVFDSYEELLNRMEMHTKESLVYYWRRDSRTVERAFTKTTRPINVRLKYYFVRFACIYGGMKMPTKGCKKRASQPKRTDCMAHVLLRASKCGQKLEVISVCNDHNHEISVRASQKLPQNRRLPEDVKEEVLEMLKLKIDRKKIIEYVQQRDNKKITPKDLFNLAARVKSMDCNSVEASKRIKTLQKINRYTFDQSIRILISNELAACEPDQSVYYSLDNNDLVEYISPEHEFRVNETIIDSIVEARKREIETDRTNGWCTTQVLAPPPPKDSSASTTIIVANQTNVDELLNETNDMRSTLQRTELLVENIMVDKSNNNNFIDETDSTIVIYENNLSHDYESETFEDDHSNTTEVCSVVLYETTTDDFIKVPDDGTVTIEDNFKEVKRRTIETRKSSTSSSSELIRKQINLVGKRISRCQKCRTDSRLVKAQVDYLRAKRDKLLEETRLLTLKRRKLMNEIERL